MDAPYLDTSRPVADRVQDLIGRLTLEEKIGQMLHEARAIPRLGVPAYNWWSEALHGVAANGRATIFPQAIGLAATWDTDLVRRIASAIGDEGRAKYHAALKRNGSTDQFQGLTFWSPNINIFRDPRWGRGQETYGEDPHLTGELGAAFVRGLQGEHARYLKAAACAKHLAVHSGPEAERHRFHARISPRDLHDTYLPAFKKLVVEAGVEAVMGAYNRVNGEPCCASQLLLVDVLRGRWGFEGHVVSDCWALTDIHAHHQFTAGAVETAALALKRGCDLSCGCTYDLLDEAVERGLIVEADIDRSLARTLTTRFKLGMFDPPELVPFASTPTSVVNSPEHRRLALEAALKSIVLLKNQDKLLPIRESHVRRIFVTGPNAASIEVLLGNYAGLNDSLVTLLEGIVGRAPEGLRVGHRTGCRLDRSNVNPMDWASPAAAAADIVVACMGSSPLVEGEEGESILSPSKGDRLDIELPAAQVEYLKKLASYGSKVVLVLCGGSPIALGGVENLAHAIVFAWYPGQEGGTALARVLFGDTSPSGKLPMTFPHSLAQLPPFEDYAMAGPLGRTYRYMTAEPLYPFGFGLSYTRFAYGDLKLAPAGASGHPNPAPEPLAAGESLSVQFTLTNAGPVDADEIAQLYLSDLEASATVPRHKLVGFRRVHLRAGESTPVALTITPEMMMFVDENGEQRLEPGLFRVTAGGCSPGARGLALGAPEPVSALFVLE